ncbi:hypothetical protein B0A48_11988 [Cryoendolithus antarcticus]|uniref:Uncharacterized protein n=1 Tax=Cryoendolithus antarcticus TaxID=1507870 RepID=A0A1V8STV8_9PEZI|nr:hypothetical protein B0A48_11988 [Cryoendolithus antarcticus]
MADSMFTKFHPNGKVAFDPATAAHTNPKTQFRRVLKFLASDIQLMDKDQEGATAILACLEDPLNNRMRCARIGTTDWPSGNEATAQRIKQHASMCRDHDVQLFYISEDMKRPYAKRIDQLRAMIMFNGREYITCSPCAAKEGGVAPDSHRHIKWYDFGKEIVEEVTEKLYELVVDTDIYDVQGHGEGAKWVLKDEFKEKLEEMHGRFDELEDSEDPRELVYFLFEELSGEGWDGARYRVEDLTAEETKEIQKLTRKWLGKPSNARGLFEDQKLQWCVTVWDTKAKKLKSEEINLRKHIREFLGPRIADIIAKTNNVAKKKATLMLYRKTKLRVSGRWANRARIDARAAAAAVLQQAQSRVEEGDAATNASADDDDDEETMEDDKPVVERAGTPEDEGIGMDETIDKGDQADDSLFIPDSASQRLNGDGSVMQIDPQLLAIEA